VETAQQSTNQSTKDCGMEAATQSVSCETTAEHAREMAVVADRVKGRMRLEDITHQD